MHTPIAAASILGGSSESRRAATQFLNRLVWLGMLLLLAGFCLPAHAQTGEWVWMGGNGPDPLNQPDGSALNRPAVYGTLGTPAPDNTPGARAGALSWTDAKGNLWLFGGSSDMDMYSPATILNDLWEFNPSTNEWAWMGGSSSASQIPVYGTLGTPAPGNAPGTRDAYSTWRDGSGHLWLFGGLGAWYGIYSTANLNDLWEFDPSTNEWTWMGGSSTANQKGVYGALGTPAAGNIPGSRSGQATWTDNDGNFWLFGGGGLDSAGNGGNLTDLWEFNPSTNLWTWRSGSNTANQEGVYGTLGTPAPGNIPAPRSGAVTWTDDGDHLWLLAGMGAQESDGWFHYLDDIWEFDPSVNEWAWMGGSSTNSKCDNYGCGLDGVYGTLGTPAAGNIPGARDNATSWTDSDGNLWLFGGAVGVPMMEYSIYGNFNDLWKFNPSSNEWAWMSGNQGLSCTHKSYSLLSECAMNGNYGTLGTANAGNIPSGRNGASIWTDTGGHLWLFGGNTCFWLDGPYYPIDPACGPISDLWEYFPDGAPTPATPTFSLSSGTYTSPQTVSISDSTPGAVIYYTLDGSTPKASSARYSAPLTISNAGTVIKAYAGELGYHNTAVTNIKYWIRPAAPTFSLPSGQYLTPQPLTISNTFAGATIYYTTDGSRPSASSTPYTGPITIDKNMTISATVALAGYSDSPLTSAAYAVKTAAPTFSPPSGEYLSPQSLTISAAPGATIYYTTDGSGPTAGSTPYTGAIPINKNVRIRATAITPGYANSPNATAAYAIKAPAPTFSLPSGIYPGPQQITISDSVAGAAIYYTTDGTTPTSSSTPYTGSITVSSKEKIIAVATATGYANSPLVAAAYGIK